MTRAILIVLNSVGCGGAEDAASYGDEGADTLGHIAEACANGRGDREGLRRGPLKLPRLEALGLGHAMKASTGRAPPGFALARAARPMGLRDRDLPRQGHAVRPLGDRRHAGRFRLGLFPRDDSRLPGKADRRADRRGQARRDSRQPPRFGHRGDRGLSARSTCERSSRSATLPPTRCFRSPRTRRRSVSSVSMSFAGSPAASAIR